MFAASAGGRLLAVVVLRWRWRSRSRKVREPVRMRTNSGCTEVGGVDLAGLGWIDDCTYGSSFRQLQLFGQDTIFPNTVAESESYRQVQSCQCQRLLRFP